MIRPAGTASSSVPGFELESCVVSVCQYQCQSDTYSPRLSALLRRLQQLVTARTVLCAADLDLDEQSDEEGATEVWRSSSTSEQL